MQKLTILLAASGIVVVGLVCIVLGAGGCSTVGGCAGHAMMASGGCGAHAGHDSGQATTPATGATSSAGIVNTRCPITGGAIKPDSVPASLTRDYKGRKVAFCCGSCPGTWDKLSDADKEARLAKVAAVTQQAPPPAFRLPRPPA